LVLAGLIRILILTGLIRSLAWLLILAGFRRLAGLLLRLTHSSGRGRAYKGASPSQRAGECQRGHGRNVDEIALC
jgi:hypothetical protein